MEAICLESAAMSQQDIAKAERLRKHQFDEMRSMHFSISAKHNQSTVARWSAEDQERVLSLFKSGESVDSIVKQMNCRIGRKGRFVQVEEVVALIERGIPFPALADELWRCPTCNAKIVTDFCIACRVKGENQNEN
jgi:hypothetical protein